MKRALLLLILLSACTSAVEKKMEIKLTGNPTTGYDWQVSCSDESILLLTNNEYLSEESELVGVGGDFLFSFQALKAGNVILEFTYQRPWVEGEALYNLQYEFNISDELTISLVEIKGTYPSDDFPLPNIIN
jgi:inhibitor of cysteine peptidase